MDMSKIRERHSKLTPGLAAHNDAMRGRLSYAQEVINHLSMRLREEERLYDNSYEPTAEQSRERHDNTRAAFLAMIRVVAEYL